MNSIASNNFNNSRFLIIDSIKQSREMLKNFANGLGCARVDTASRNFEVVNKCAEINYDVLLLGYDLGEGRENGQQILEELRERSLIGRHCIVIMITGEITQAMVLAALEHKPSEYVTKPYTLSDLLTRLERCYKKVTAMRSIYHALDQQDLTQVIKLCDQALDKGTAYTTECLGIMSRQYFELNQFDLAKEIYQSTVGLPNCQWASVGLGKIALKENQPEQAIRIFENLLAAHPKYMMAYDYLAQAYLETGDNRKAEKVLQNAINLSPRSFKRVKSYAELCYENESYGDATSAFFKTQKLSKNSIHRSPDNAFGLAKSFIEYSPELPDHKIRRLKSEVSGVLSEAAREFSSQEVKIQTGLLTARLHFLVREVIDAMNALTRAERLLDANVDDLSHQGLEEIADSLIKLDRTAKAKDILYVLEQSKQEELALHHELNDESSEYTLTELQEAQQATDIAISHYRESNYELAIERLNEALELYPNHIGLKLNLLQVLLVSYENDRSNKTEHFIIAGKIIKRLEEITINGKSTQRFAKLKHRYQKLKRLNG